MDIVTLGSAINAAGAGSSVNMVTAHKSPFIPNQKVKGEINCNGLSGQMKIQGSDDNSSWTDLLDTGSLTTSDRTKTAVFELKKYMRYNMVSRTAGDVDVHILRGA